MEHVFDSEQFDGVDRRDALLPDDRILVETLTTPGDDRSVAVVITITLLLTVVVGVSSHAGMAASLALCAMCAALAKVKAAGRFWTTLPATFAALSAIALLAYHL